MEWIILNTNRYVIILSIQPSGTAFINVSAILIFELPLLTAFVTPTKISFTIFIMVDKKVYPFCIKYFNNRKDTKDIAILSQLILSTSIAFFIKLIIKKSISKLKATGTITSFTVFPMLQILMVFTLEKLVNFCIEPIRFPLSISTPNTENLKLYRSLIIPSNY